MEKEMETNTDLTSRLSVREHIGNMRRILRVVGEMDRSYFATAAIVHLINAGVPHLALLLSSWILTALEQGEEFSEIFSVAAASLLAFFLLNLTACGIWNRLLVREDTMYWKYLCSVEQKMLTMDFAKIDSPELKDLKRRIQGDMNWGAGLYSVFWQANDLIFRFCHLCFACLVGIPVFVVLIRHGGPAQWAILLLLALLLAAGVCLSLRFHKKLAFWQSYQLTEDKEREEGVCFTWGFAMGDDFKYQNGQDARIYDGYDLLKSWSIDRERAEGNMRRLMQMARYSRWAEFWSELGGSVTQCGSYLVVGLLALMGALTIGNVVRLSVCLSNVLSDVQALVERMGDFSLTARRHMSTLDLLGLQDEMYKGKLPVEKRSDNEYQVEFKDVSFRYPGAKEYAIRHLSLKLRIGEKLAIVGMNGSGKTTMIKLLCRLYDPCEGEILLNGVDIRKFKQEEYAKLFAVVFQDYSLFSFPLGENVAVAEEYDAARVAECLRAAGLGERTEELGLTKYLYKDYDDQGVELSGGEAQKVAIARAVYKDAPFILLDEPTAALDPVSEYEIYTSFDRVIGTKTAIYISHRLSSCRFCEKIAVFHEGKLVQTGSHEELLKEEQGKYYELWQAQARYYEQ